MYLYKCFANYNDVPNFDVSPLKKNDLVYVLVEKADTDMVREVLSEKQKENQLYDVDVTTMTIVLEATSTGFELARKICTK